MFIIRSCTKGRTSYFESRIHSTEFLFFLITKKRCALLEAVWSITFSLLTTCKTAILLFCRFWSLCSRNLCTSKIEITSKPTKINFFFLFYGIMLKIVPLIWCLLVLNRWTSSWTASLRSSNRWLNSVTSYRHREKISSSNSSLFAFLIHCNTKTRYTKLHRNIFLCLFLQSFIQILFQVLFLDHCFVIFRFRDFQTLLISKCYLLITKWA